MVHSMPLLLILAYLWATFGHAALWIGFVNHIHGLALPRLVIRCLTVAAYSWLAAGPVLFARMLAQSWSDSGSAAGLLSLPWGLAFYVAFCCAIAVGPL